MNTVILVVVVGVMVGLMALMVNYARFIHKGPENPDEGNNSNPPSHLSNRDKDDSE